MNAWDIARLLQDATGNPAVVVEIDGKELAVVSVSAEIGGGTPRVIIRVEKAA